MVLNILLSAIIYAWIIYTIAFKYSPYADYMGPTAADPVADESTETDEGEEDSGEDAEEDESEESSNDAD